MEVIQARSAGFCFGVDRAVKLAEELARTERQPRMLGSVIHNSHVVEALARQGMTAIASPEEAQPGDCVLLRAHGAERAVYDALERRGGTGGGRHLSKSGPGPSDRCGGGERGPSAGDDRRPHPPGGPGHWRLVQKSFGI